MHLMGRLVHGVFVGEQAAGDASIGSQSQGAWYTVTNCTYRNVQLVTAAEDLPTPPEPPPRRKVA